MVKLGFDGVKFDAGGGNDDMNRWARELNASGREIMIENCNNGGDVPYPLKDAHGNKLPTPPAAGDDCPFNMFRTGIDNAPSPLSMVSNLMDTARHLNVSRCVFNKESLKPKELYERTAEHRSQSACLWRTWLDVFSASVQEANVAH